MSGDVQPRKRKDKKRKKDELGLEEPRGTSAVFGEGDVFMHSQHNHGTGGHWCAKIIFFSLLAVLVTLIGLIILENRGLTELEANSVESRYSGVLDGWIEETPSDEHTLELQHHVEEKENELELESLDRDNEDSDEDENIPFENEDNDIDDNNDDENSKESEENTLEENHEEDEEELQNYRRYFADSAEEQLNHNENDELDESHENHKTTEQDDSNYNNNEHLDNLINIKNKRDSNDITYFQDEDDIANDYSRRNKEEDVKYDIEDEKENELQSDDQDIEDSDEDTDNVAYENEDNNSDIDDNNNSQEAEQQTLKENHEEVEEENHYHRKYVADSALGETNHNENEDSDEFNRKYYENYKSEEQGNANYIDDDDVNNVIDINNEVFENYNDGSNEYSTQIEQEQNLKYIEDDEDNNDDDNEEEEEDTGVEIERIERDYSEQVLISTELPALPEQDDEDKGKAIGDNDPGQEDDSEEEEDNDEEFLESDDDIDAPIVEHITVPPGKPFVEVDEEISSEKPSRSVPDTLAEEEEYEKRQEELRREEEQASHKDGGNSVEDEWPGEPSDLYWRQQLDKAEEELRQGAWSSCRSRVSSRELADSGRARWLAALALDVAAEQRRDNALLSQAITAYLHLLKMNERLSDKKILEVTKRTINRIQFRGTYLSAEPVYRLLIRRFPNDPAHRHNLSTSFLMANRADLAEEVLKETLQRWPNDKLALAHYGFVLKTQHNRLEEAVIAFGKALEGDTGPANEPRFYYHLGDSLILLGRFAEAYEVHKRATILGHFLSPAQRSLYNVPRLKSQPWWNVEDTPYVKLARTLENSWRDILKEGEAAHELYVKEKEGLKERGDWSQLDLFVRGKEIPNRCKNAPVTCSIVRAEAAAAGCRRGQVKFSSMAAGTHVRPHVGPTNCRLRMHLGLSNTKNTFIRVDQETRQWEVGKVLLFDDSFEHEVWHNGTGPRLVLIVDIWHPDLTPAEWRQLPAI